jgi:hypothetical protein
MILVAGGDSFIFGTELKDQIDPNPSLNTFTALLASINNLEYSCAAYPGNANNAISRMTITECEQLRSQGKSIAVMISWTYTDRFEFRFNYNTEQKISPWYSINSWTCEDDESIIQHFTKFFNKDEVGLNRQLDHLKTAQQTGVAQFSKEFFKHVGNNKYYEVYATLKEIVFMQNYLKANNIPYLFTLADNSYYEIDNYRRNNDKFLKSLYEQIDWNQWYFFPKGTQVNETRIPRGFYQWAIESKYQIGISHPLEQAHSDAAELIKEKFNELVTKSVQSN